MRTKKNPGLNTFKFSGLANAKAVGLAGAKSKDGKESIVLTRTSKDLSKTGRATKTIGVAKGQKKAAKNMAAALALHRRDLTTLAMAKYKKIKASFKKTKIQTKSARLTKA